MTTLFETYKTEAERLTGTIPPLDGIRSSALARFSDTGIPGSKAEAFRYADLKSLNKTAFPLADKPVQAVPLPTLSAGVAARFVFVNGFYDEDLSETVGDISELSVRRLANHFVANPDRASEVAAGEDGLALLNTALMQDGLAIQLGAGQVVDGAIEVLHVFTGAAGRACHPRLLVELGEGASFRLIEHAIGDETAHWFNPVTQIRLSESASLTHVRLIAEGAGATVTARSHVRAGTKACYRALNGLFSGQMVRVETHVKALGSGADLTVDGLSLAAPGRRHDCSTHLDHQVPHSDSDQVFRSVVSARGVSSFQGKVTVAVDAQKTEANQSFKALVLDRSGEANAKPELEILADDVQCAHGATIGELDGDALFYLISRGVEPKAARGLLIRSFLGDALVRFEGTEIASLFEAKLNAWFDENLGDGDA